MPRKRRPAFAADGEGLDQDVVERFARVEPAAELGGLGRELVVGHRLVLRLQGVDRLDLRLQALRMNRALAEPNSAVMPRSNRPRMALPIAGEDFPNSFQNFHDQFYGQDGARRIARAGAR